MRRLLHVSVLLLSVVAGACKDEGGITVRRLDFQGVKAVDQARLKAALVTRESAWLPWGKKRFFDQARLERDDLQRIQAFYADRGYPDARATFDVHVNREQTAVDIVVTVTEGTPVVVTAVNFLGFDVVPPSHLKHLQDDSPVKVGTPRDRQLVLATRDLAQNELRDHGYPYARVSQAESLDSTGRLATLVFAAEPGVLAHFGSIDVVTSKPAGAGAPATASAAGTGTTTDVPSRNKGVSDHVILRELDYKPGDLYSRSAIQNAQRRLYGMALFQFVDIKQVDPDQQSPEVRTRITIAEGKHQRVNLGVGYGSEEHARVDAEYRHLNFFGAGRTAGIHGRLSSLDRGLRADFTQPYFFDPHLSLGAEGQRWYTFAPAYESIVTGARTSVTHRSGLHTSIAVSMTLERNLSTIKDEFLNSAKFLALRSDLIALGLDPTTGKQEGTLTSFGVDLQRTTTDNLLNPTKGYQVTFHAEEAGVALPGTFNYYAASIDSRYYRAVSQRLVMAGRLQIGNINAVGSGGLNVPFSRKYFLGGATSLRGWGRYEVSPLSTSGLPIGGNSLLGFSVEGRAIVRGSLGAVLFLDAGNVWTDAGEFHPRDLRYAIGPGFRYQTPIGPIRVDFGYQLNPIPGLIVGVDKDGQPQGQAHRFRFNFSIGQAF